MRAAAQALASAAHEVQHPTKGAALAEAKRQNSRETDLVGWCLLSTRTWLGVRSQYRSAIEAWRGNRVRDRHPGDKHPPAGVPVFWEIGQWGHIALSAGHGYVVSTDIRRRGKADLVPLELVAQRWGAKYLGWAETLNGERVWHAPAKPKPKPRRKVAVAAGGAVLVAGGAAGGVVVDDAPKPKPPVVAKPHPKPKPAKVTALSKAVRPGAHTAQVRDVRAVLIRNGYGPIGEKPADWYGPITRASVHHFLTVHPKYASGPGDDSLGPAGWRSLQLKIGRS